MKKLQKLLEDGDSIHRMMQVTGEEGISLEDYVKWQKSVLLDIVYLQQDAFDPVDASMPRERQVESFYFLQSVIDNNYDFADRDMARDFFIQLTSLYKNWNYAAPGAPDYARYRDEITELVNRHKGHPERRAAERDAED